MKRKIENVLCFTLHPSSLPNVLASSWLLLSVLSAFLLGIYDAAKKASVRGNAVPPALFLAVVCRAAVWVPLLVVGRICPRYIPFEGLLVPPINATMHAALLLKSAIVGTSWTLAYFALKRLPLTIAGPLRAIGPLWTILLATLLLGERPTHLCLLFHRFDDWRRSFRSRLFISVKRTCGERLFVLRCC